MTVTLEKPQIERDWSGALGECILAAVPLANPTPASVYQTARKLRDAVIAAKKVRSVWEGSTSDGPGNRAWVWANRTLAYAAGEILVQARQMAPLKPNHEDAVKAFVERAVPIDGTELDITALSDAGSSDLFQPARDALPTLLLAATTGHDLDLDTLSERFAKALRMASYRAWCESPDYFNPIETALTGIAGSAARTEAAWARHHRWISEQFTDRPVFSFDDQDEAKIPLAGVYQRLRCFWHNEIANEDESQPTKTAHVADLHKTAWDWLAQDNRNDPIRLVVGGPGCGKSTFARALAHEVIETGKYRVFLIELQNLQMTGQLHQDLRHYVETIEARRHGGVEHAVNPLDPGTQGNMPILFLFDGLDELSANKQTASDLARNFLLSAKDLMFREFGIGATAKALILGRNVAFAEAQSMNLFATPDMLHVAPIAPMDWRTCQLPQFVSPGQADLFDPDDLMKIDQRIDYWHAWAAANRFEDPTPPEPVTNDAMSELNLEPLLLHLLIISDYCGPDWERAAENRNLVYDDILTKIYRRNNQKGMYRHDPLTEEEFFLLMESLGLAAFRGNGRTGTRETFDAVRDIHVGRKRRKKFRERQAADLKSVALNLHTRPGGADDEDGFEFIHKSFGEYLAARGLLEHARRITKEVEEGVDVEEFEEEWMELIGPGEVSANFANFLYGEAKRLLKEDEAIAINRAMTEFLDQVIAHGFPAHKLPESLSWRDRETHQRCAETALLGVASAAACRTPTGDPEKEDPKAWLVSPDWSAGYEAPRRFLERLEITHLQPSSHLCQRLNLGGSDLSGANLRGASLIGANLKNAMLHGAFLDGANLIAADLGSAFLRDAFLDGAFLINANLSRANLSIARLTRAHLNGANLSDAKLDGAFLFEADLEDANLQGAHLEGAHLRGADLHKSKGVTVDQLNSAKGNQSTRLPEYIDPASVIWSQKEY